MGPSQDDLHHRDRCAIAGIGSTDFSKDSGRSDLSLAVQAALAACDDAGIAPTDIDGIVRCDADLVRHNDLLHTLGLRDLAYWGETGPGGTAPCGMVGQAVGAILSGQATTVLVFRSLNGRSGARYGLAHRVSNQARIGGNGTYDEYFHPYGLVTPGQIFAIMAQRHLLRVRDQRPRISEPSPWPAGPGPTTTHGRRCTTARSPWTTTWRAG